MILKSNNFRISIISRPFDSKINIYLEHLTIQEEKTLDNNIFFDAPGK